MVVALGQHRRVPRRQVVALVAVGRRAGAAPARPLEQLPSRQLVHRNSVKSAEGKKSWRQIVNESWSSLYTWNLLIAS